MIEACAAWLEATAVARGLRASLWAYPLVNALHLVGISLLVGSITVLDLRLLGWRRSVAVTQLTPVVLPVARAGFALAVTTGGLLFVTRATDYVSSELFALKLALVLLAVANVGYVHRSAWWRDCLAAGRVDGRARIGALVSLASWLGVLLAGRLLGYR